MRSYSMKGKGTCKPGQRADLTHCVPASEGGSGGSGSVEAGETQSRQSARPARPRSRLAVTSKLPPEPEYVGEPIHFPISTSFLVPTSVAFKAGDLLVDPESRLPPETIDAVVDYTIRGFWSLNKSMRQCPPPPFTFDCVRGKDRVLMERIEQAIAAAGPLPEPLTCYRGLKVSREVRQTLLADARAAQATGRDYYLPCITSTSVNPEVVLSRFTTKEDPIGFSIKARSGLYLEPVTNSPGDYEILKSAKTRYRVVGVREGVPVVKSSGDAGAPATIIYLEEIE